MKNILMLIHKYQQTNFYLIFEAATVHAKIVMYDLLVVKFLKLITGVCKQDNSKFKGLICSVCELLWYVSTNVKTLEANSSSVPSPFLKLSPLNNSMHHTHGARKLEKNTLLLLLGGIMSKLAQQSFQPIK